MPGVGLILLFRTEEDEDTGTQNRGPPLGWGVEEEDVPKVVFNKNSNDNTLPISGQRSRKQIMWRIMIRVIIKRFLHSFLLDASTTSVKSYQQP